jgi:3-hydroxyacyl-CoA dehydrogenase
VAAKKFADRPADAAQYVQATMANVTVTTDADAAARTADLVVEAIVENLEVKRTLFARLDKAAPAHAIFASNTSSLPIHAMATATRRTDRFGGLHFFNPVPVMRLVEIVRARETSDATFAQLTAFGRAVGKATVACKDTPGFVVNRLLVPYMLEAVRMAAPHTHTQRDEQ